MDKLVWRVSDEDLEYFVELVDDVEYEFLDELDNLYHNRLHDVLHDLRDARKYIEGLLA